MLFAILVIALFFVLLIPQLVEQTAALVKAAPEYIQGLRDYLSQRFPSLLDDQSSIRQSLDSFVAGLRARVRRVCQCSAGFGLQPGRRDDLHRRCAGRGVLHAARLGPNGGNRGRVGAARSLGNRSPSGARD